MKIKIGQKASLSKTITEADVYNYAAVVEDFNGIHLNKEKAENGIFKARVAHGMMVGSLISAVLGTKLPGEGTIYLEQNLKFKAPVYFGDTVTAKVEVTHVLNEGKGIYRLETIVVNQKNKCVIDGNAVVQYNEKYEG